MKAAYGKGGAGIDAVEIREIDDPSEPGPGEALVRLTAATLNYRDLIMVKGLIPGLAKEPEFVPLSCAAGVVTSVGEGVNRVAPGDRVSPLFAQGWIDGPPDPQRMLGGSMDGVARNAGIFDAESLVRLPDTLGDLEAATLPCAGLTAWSALFAVRPIKAGEWVLLQGTGGVSIAALQWAKAAGAKVAITSSSDAKLARAKALGADVGVNYRTESDWPGAVREAIGGGVDILVDVVGTGAIEESAALLNEGGIVAGIGMLDGTFSWGKDEEIGHMIARISVGNRGAHEAMLAFAAAHAIRPVVDMVYDLDRLVDAMHHLESGGFFGKIGINLL
ncbi:zinc-dependent alcohol dehydrogenase family protein [Stakelama tenebrarum]|uniref:NAD(P)-dependent alcohol dehydrogenase n=1 Tax=Stakelama tenebrarum TaxID=2711215 RepID=A0A6G6Y764_9SPHN|nr:NAD(P)-dependent alcohol dehydrogenase [Sphingosinithalassobacter tenebrarum]QIG80782.1 NAD(P)-dependent alcohol dehydrogenase [Sphingosinithalassobacter tenebrarum]